ncbi:MAG TPA: ADP-ribosyltransferase [Mucilaginibacter sp.]
MILEADKIKMAQSADEIYKRKHVPLTAAYLKKPDDHANLEDVQSGKVSIEHGDAISNYSGGLSDPVNGALRGDYIGYTVEIKAYDKALSAALESLPSWNNKTVYRMVKYVEDITPYEAYFNRTLNKVLHEPCYLSSSKEEWEEEKVIYKIKTLKKDSHARDVS